MASSPPKSKKQKVEEAVVPAITQLPFRFIEKHSNKTTKLLANSKSTTPLDGQNRWYEFKFTEPTFIYRIVVNATNYPDYRSFEIQAVDEDGKSFESTKSPSSGKVVLPINRYCKEVKFKPPKAYFSDNKTIDAVELFGFPKSKAGEFIQFARDLDQLKADALADIESREAVHQSKIEQAETAEARTADARKELEGLKGQADRQRAAIRRLESERTDLTTKSELLKDTLEKNGRELEAIRSELGIKGRNKKNLEEQTTILSSRLSQLRSNLDLFPTELESFVKQGTRNVRTLFWLALLPILTIGGMFALLVSGAVELTTKITPDQNLNIEALIVSRMPYVIVALAIITACYQIARFFISELININRQRLSLTKISIIAKDVSVSSEGGLELSDTERYALRAQLKMELLKDHLKGYVSPDLKVQLPKRITNYLPFGSLIADRIEEARESLKASSNDEANPETKNPNEQGSEAQDKK